MEQLEDFQRDYAGATSREMCKKLLSESGSDCGMSYVQRKIGKPQIPQAVISYSWDCPWRIIIEYLKRKNVKTVWIDLLACDQHAIKRGSMDEIMQLPTVIEFIGQTLVMPGTLKRIWCIYG